MIKQSSRLAVVLLTLIFLAQPGGAQVTPLIQQDFDAAGAGTSFTLGGGAAIAGQELNLTAAGDGTLLFDGTPINSALWELEFDVSMDPGPDGVGIIFTSAAGSVGYAGIFFDVYQNPGDPNDNHIEITPVWGMWGTQYVYSPSFDMNNSEWFHVRLRYENQLLSIFVTPAGGAIEQAFGLVPVISGVEWFLMLFGLNTPAHRVDNVVLLVEALFERGDCNADGTHDIADPVTALTSLFVSGTAPGTCTDAFDANDDGVFNIADPITSLTRLFGGGPPLPEPFATCGIDPTSDALTCDSFAPCP